MLGTFDAPVLPGVLQLADDVEETRIDGTLVLHSRSELRGVKISPAARQLLPLLRDGATFDQLCEHAGRPASPAQRAKLTDFLVVLRDAGLFRHSVRARRRRLVRYATWDLSGPAARLGAVLRSSRLAAVLASALAVSSAIALLWGASVVVPQLVGLAVRIVLVPSALIAGIAVLVAIVIPVHELAHAVVAGACGVRATRLVVARRGWSPAIFCETPGSSLLRNRFLRIAIPAAGPAVDLGFGLAFGALALASRAPWTPFLAAMAWMSCIAFILDCNPYANSDGSRVLEIIVDDDSARLGAISRHEGIRAKTAGVRWYLALTVLYVVGVVSGIGSLGVAVFDRVAK